MEGREILKRSSLLSLLLVLAIAFVGMRTYQLWQEGPGELPKAGKARDSLVGEKPKRGPDQARLVNTKNIIGKNLFDPERGAGKAQEAKTSSVAMQRIRNMVLLGTAILGDGRYAILKSASDPNRVSSRKSQPSVLGPTRFKLGDTLEGFKLAEIHAQRVVFKRGSFTVEVALDFSRKIEKVKGKVKAPRKAKKSQKARKSRRARKKSAETTPGL